MTQPRFHHYQFVHVALPQIAFAEGWALTGILGSPVAQDFLASVLQQVKAAGEPQHHLDFDASDIGLRLTRVLGLPSALIEMPPPSEMTEAFFAVIVFLGSVVPPVRYFTLELTDSWNGSLCTVLGEWAPDEAGQLMHLHLGPGPAPDPVEFLRAVSLLVKEATPNLS